MSIRGGTRPEPEHIPPNAARLIGALRQIGYSFEQAVSDLIDNSINAAAENVLLRFYRDDKRVLSFVVVDDGQGMNDSELHDAMRFGSDNEADPLSLGKFGMGLKLASLSHAKVLTVVSRKSGRVYGRRWTIEGIERDWQCEVLLAQEAENLLSAPLGGLDLSKHGTLVIWDDIDRMPTSSSGINATLRNLQKRLQLHIGLHFHRFLEDGRLNVFVDQQRPEEPEHSIRPLILPLNPFHYPVSGNPEYPKTFQVNLPDIGRLNVEAHIWPANSDLPEYKLGNRAAARQGFYFYRNDRLIQPGGWNGVVQHETEPHSSLARVVVELPPSMDSFFGLNVQKSSVQAPPGFPDAVAESKAGDGTTFDFYRRAAQVVYRKKDGRALKDYPLVPTGSIPKEVATIGEEILAEEASKVRHVDFVWEEFESGDLFAIDRDNKTIKLNQAYRKYLNRGLPSGKTDVPLIKLLIFFLLVNDLDREKLSGKRREELKRMNDVLTTAARLGRG